MKSAKARKKILLVVAAPPSYRFAKLPFWPFSPPLGLAYIAAVLEKNKYEVKILDMTVEPLTKKGYRDYLRKYNPNIIGFSVTVLNYFITTKFIKLTKEMLPNSLLILGGPFASVMRKKALRENPSLDLVVYGEGEETMLDIVKNKKISSIKGIIFRQGKDIKVNPPRPRLKNLDSIPFPARHLLKMEKYWDPLTLLSSRGCPYSCIFCSSSKTWGRIWRPRSPKNIVDEIEYLYKNYGYLSEDKCIHVVDDLFNLDLNRAKSICDEIIKRGLRTKFTFWGFRVDHIDKELVMKLKRVGCQRIDFGIESGDQKILNNIGKGITLNQIRRAVRLVKEAGMKVSGYFMIGNPGETLSTVRKTIEFARQLNLDFTNHNLAVPLPGTKLYKWVKNNGRFLIRDPRDYPDTFTSPKPAFETNDFKAEERIQADREFTEFVQKFGKSSYHEPGFSRLNKILTLSENETDNIQNLRKALIKIHYQCNNNCLFCHAADKRNIQPLSLEQIKTKIKKALQVGAEMVLFSGGEPTLHPDFPKVVNFLWQRKIPWGLITNGRLLSYRKLSEKLLERNLKYVYLTLNSANPETHDFITRAPGSFNQTLRALKNLSGHQIELIVNVVVTKFNLKDLKKIVDLVEEFKINRIKFSLVEPKGEALKNFNKLIPSLKEASLAINGAMGYAISENIKTGFDGLPDCLVDDPDLKDNLQTNNILYISEVFEDRFYRTDEGQRIKGKCCRLCSRKKVCPGIYEGYRRCGGLSDLKPIR